SRTHLLAMHMTTLTSHSTMTVVLNKSVFPLMTSLNLKKIQTNKRRGMQNIRRTAQAGKSVNSICST
ncbi:hypothetical protein, partial [Ralstonia pseudosolanacearum]|uniref:hypothetical protein n=1 Tax=Ralstonia pseudosolanacearum TaxID=1310165 RepID=UPI001FF729D0